MGQDVVAARFMRSDVDRENDHPLRFAKHFSAAVHFWGGDLCGLSRNRVGALVEQVEARFPFVGWNPFADGLPERLDGIEGVDVER